MNSARAQRPPMTSSDPDRIRRVRELFDLVMEQELNSRSQFLNVVAMYDPPDITREVEELLTAERDTHSLPGFSGDDERAEAIPGLIGQRLGAYSVMRHIGNGGMGAVYEAVRADDEYRTRVAIKLVHRRLDSQITLERFHSDRKRLANLEHRNIATLLDGGVAADGRPFLVMEFVDGIHITKWCDEHRAPIEARLKLFKQVCAAVQHAHLNLVVHLDLKPGNILVMPDGTVKLLDFGIARLIEGDADESTRVTRGGARPFTAEYASPESIRGEHLTTAADVYSLGVVLFELLAGKRPYTARNITNAERSTGDESVPKPSGSATMEAAARSGERNLERLRARLRGDLDSITAMALRHEPERRYQSAEALGADISRYLSRLPVNARPDSAGYRARRFIRRNIVVAGLSAAVVIALIAGVASTARQERRARAEQLKTRELSVSLHSVATMVNTGGAFLALGKLDSAEATFNEALAVRRSFGDAPDTLLASIIGNLGSVARERGQPKESERLHREALDILRRVPGPRDDKVAISMNNLAVALGDQNRWSDAEELHRKAIEIFATNHSGSHTLRADAENALATALDMQGKVAAAESTYLSVLDMRRRLLGPRHADYAFTLFNYSKFLSDQGRCDESVRKSREVLALRGNGVPESHSLIAASLQTLGSCLDKLGKHNEAGKALQESLDLSRKYLGEESWLAANSQGVLGEHFALVKQYDRAESLLLGAEQMLVAILGPANPRTQMNARRLVALYDSLGEKAMADSYRARSGASSEKLERRTP